MTYVEGFPQDGSSLGSTKAQIRTNLDGTFQTLGVDHYNNNGVNGAKTGPAGKHAQVTMPTQPAAPTTAAGQGALYTKTGAQGTQLFWVRDNVNQTEVPLTIASSGIVVPVARAQVGYTFLPGNLLLQWGFSNVVSAGSGTINFGAVFANVGGFVPVVTISPQLSPVPGSGPSNQIYVTGTTISNFSYRNYSSSYPKIYWQAIGPI